MSTETVTETMPRVITMADLEQPDLAAGDVDAYATADTAGYYYAFGRLDQGHPPVAILAPDRAPSSTATSWLFGRMWAAMQRDYRDPNVGGYFPGIQPAWENFVASGGRSLYRQR